MRMFPVTGLRASMTGMPRSFSAAGWNKRSLRLWAGTSGMRFSLPPEEMRCWSAPEDFWGLQMLQENVEIGYSLSESWRGKGLPKEMVGGLVRQALSDPRVNRLVARTNEQNVRSRSVLEGNGFHVTGVGSEPGSLRYELHRSSTGVV